MVTQLIGNDVTANRLVHYYAVGMVDFATELALGVSLLAPYEGFDWKWHESPIDSNYDAEAALSAVLVTVEMATASSPTHLLLFRRGEFLHQGTPIGGAFISLRHEDCNDDTVAVRFKIPGQSNAGPPKSVHDVDYRLLSDDRVVWSGDWPYGEGPPVPGIRHVEGGR